jgi:hypothetical protein
MKHKRAISHIVLVMILLAVVLISIGIIWSVLSKISDRDNDFSVESVAVDVEIKGAGVNEESNLISVLVRRNSGPGDLTGFKFIFINSTDSELQEKETTLEEGDERVFILNPDMDLSNLLTLTIIPLIRHNDQEKLGGVGKVYTFNNLPQITAPEIEESVCGNGITEEFEVCDGIDLAGQTCETIGFDSGDLFCLYDCSDFDTSECIEAEICEPENCSSLDYQCGIHANGTCAGNINCGNCSEGYQCITGKCYVGQCTPENCSSLGYECGIYSNGTCAGVLNCGSCLEGYSCVSGECQAEIGCIKDTCLDLGYNCGNHSDGCGGNITCGTCTEGQNCINGVCTGGSCTPGSCAGKECGTYTNGTCSGILNCGSCGIQSSCNLTGTCVCNSGYADCNNDNTCECNLSTSYCSGGTCNTPNTLCNGLALLFHLNRDTAIGESNILAFDFSKSRNNGTIHGGAAWNSSGKFGGAFEFDGKDDWVDAGTSRLGISNSREFTISVWVRLKGDVPVSSYDVIAARGKYVRPFMIEWYGNSNRLRFGVRNISNVYYFNSPDNSILPNSQWKHILLSRNSSGSVLGYINGNRVVNRNVASNLVVDSGERIVFASSGTGSYLNATLDEIAIWNRSLTVSEIAKVYSGVIAC